ncbi:hypothetical protein MMC24_002134 [Lignoscripta atroalba]|nr:hypothetical protein [Lignoscripta atroalba]
MTSPLRTPPVPVTSARLDIHTYHCLCTQLLLATPYVISDLPCRVSPSLDHAIILQLGTPPRPRGEGEDGDDANEGEFLADEGEGSEEAVNRDEARQGERGAQVEGQSNRGTTTRKEGAKQQTRIEYSLLLSTTVDRKPVIVRREDGFEKRWLRRCGRCRIAVGYMLAVEGNHGTGKEGGGRIPDGKVVFLLPGGLVETKELRREGWEAKEGDVVLG